MSTEAEDDWRYWKAAISCLPTQETRDAAWEFFVRHQMPCRRRSNPSCARESSVSTISNGATIRTGNGTSEPSPVTGGSFSVRSTIAPLETMHGQRRPVQPEAEDAHPDHHVGFRIAATWKTVAQAASFFYKKL